MRRAVTLRTVVSGTAPNTSRSFFMNSPLTLHDFVINLLSDADARAAFDLDPDSALREAGLTDVTAADVRDVIPLVADFAPAHVAGLHGSLPEFATSALGTDRAGPLHQFQFVSSQLTGVTNDLAIAAGGVASGATGLTGIAPAVSAAPHLSGDAGITSHVESGHGAGATLHGSAAASGGAGVSGDFSPAHDLAGTLDPAGADATGVLSGAGGTLGGTLTGTVTGAVHDTLGGSLGGLAHDPVGHLTGTLDTTVHGVAGIGSGVLDTGHLLDHTGLTGALPAGVSHVVPAGLPDLHGATGLLHGSAPLGLGGTADSAASGHASTDAHLLDLPHLL
jgi:hypothetical protein